MREVESHDSAWRDYFADSGIKPFKVVYEEFIERQGATARELLTFLGVPRPADLGGAKRRITKQADAISDEWVQRYRRTAGA